MMRLLNRKGLEVGKELHVWICDPFRVEIARINRAHLIAHSLPDVLEMC
jgi:hypothetical protein